MMNAFQAVLPSISNELSPLREFYGRTLPILHVDAALRHGRIDRVRPLTPTPMCATAPFNWDIRLSLFLAVVGDGLHA